MMMMTIQTQLKIYPKAGILREKCLEEREYILSGLHGKRDSWEIRWHFLRA